MPIRYSPPGWSEFTFGVYKPWWINWGRRRHYRYDEEDENGPRGTATAEAVTGVLSLHTITTSPASPASPAARHHIINCQQHHYHSPMVVPWSCCGGGVHHQSCRSYETHSLMYMCGVDVLSCNGVGLNLG